MQTTPVFFIPHVPAEDQESAYAQLAARCRQAARPLDERVYSIRFVHDGEEWTATVGKTLRGSKTVRKKSGGRQTEHVQHLVDGATVTAIFPGHPYFVVLDGAPSKWENPFMAGTPREVVRFGKA